MPNRKRKWRENTVEEKRKMQRERKKRKRNLRRENKRRDLQEVERSERLDGVTNKALRYKRLAQKYMQLWKDSATKKRLKAVSVCVYFLYNFSCRHINLPLSFIG